MDNILLYGGLGTGAVASFCYLLYRNRETVVRKIEEAPVLKLGPELVSKLQSLEDKTILYGVINGTVHPVKDHITGTHDSSVSALIQTITIQEHKSEWSKASRVWSDSVRTISKASKEVPIKCVQQDEFGNTGIAFIQEPLVAESLKLDVIHDKFEPASSSVTESLVQWASGEKTKGFQTTEEVLPTGTMLTGIGEIVLENDQVQLRPPQSPLRYILSTLPLSGILRDQRSATKFWRAVAVVLGFGSSVMLLIWLYRVWRSYQDGVVSREILSSIDERVVNGGVVEGTQCVVCMDNPRDVVILDCGHICVCRECARRLQNCPVCRRTVERIVYTYNS